MFRLKEYFIVAYSGPAPLVSDTSFHFIFGKNPEDALLRFRAAYSHRAGLYAATVYRNANDYHRHGYADKWLAQYTIGSGQGTMNAK